ncbi:uncharacterized protein MAM_07866 [Metarhizium album ARSEF 1941]|uniref:Uncharacterized protein n=1 Tax=Metarhizium album (strain ARSEF 1941) TaxID=1081103 RepID=A0A0B2WMI9_METAS|nr:uncharacterized protein MAM_07866 [Metarhizium album ARSEF 1941]KHN94230.1 hypothetical protein MAM_07866 [Metarhizium album ARSEF 1941]
MSCLRGQPSLRRETTMIVEIRDGAGKRWAGIPPQSGRNRTCTCGRLPGAKPRVARRRASAGMPPRPLKTPSPTSRRLPWDTEERFVHLCVRKSPASLKLLRVDVSSATSDQSVFRRLRDAYYRERGAQPFRRLHELTGAECMDRLSRSVALLRPKKVQFITFHLTSADDEIVHFAEYTNSPVEERLFRHQYSLAYATASFPFPVLPSIFMYMFENSTPSCSPPLDVMLRLLSQERAPRLQFDPAFRGAKDVPRGFGVLIIEELSPAAVCLMAFTIGVLVLVWAGLWSARGQ